MAGAADVLMVVTSVSRLPGSDVPTGFFLRELTHPYFALKEAGVSADIATIQGGPAPIDPHSDPREPHSVVQDDIVSIGFLHSPSHACKLDTLRLADAEWDRYAAIFFAGGGAAIFDLPFDPSVKRAVQVFWESGRIVSAVCHGVGALLDVRLSAGEYLVAGKHLTGYTTEEDEAITHALPAFRPPLFIDQELRRRGAHFSQAPADKGYAVTDPGGRLVTGQNNRSGTIVGRHLAAALSGKPLDRDTVDLP